MYEYILQPERIMTNEEYTATWKRYQAAWSKVSAQERKELLRGSVAPDAIYTDPMSECHGLEELMVKIEQSQQKTPGASFENTRFLSHHQQGLSDWTMRDSEGATVATGNSYARFNEKGLLIQMTGFFELPKKPS